MLSSKKLSVLFLALSFALCASCEAKQPTSILGKLGTSVLQTVNKHPGIFSIVFTLANIYALTEMLPQKYVPKDPFIGIATTIGMTIAEWVVIDEVTQACEVDPL